MELFSGLTTMEGVLSAKAMIFNLPIGGTLELLPLCNMNCRMCYVKQSKSELDAQGNLLSCDEWLQIAESAREAGVLYLLITGGEPLLYPEFQKLYLALSDMGFILTINTNGTLLDEEWADFFAEHPCRQINITIYGKDADTYANLCGYRNGFARVTNAVRLLQERHISIRLGFTNTPCNIDQQDDFFRMVEKYQTKHINTCYCFPPYRRNLTAADIDRLSPEEAATGKWKYILFKNQGISREIVAENALEELSQQARTQGSGYHCGAGRNGFWINWKGELLPCGMFQAPSVSLLTHEFSEAWQTVSSAYQQLPVCEACENCALCNLCDVCPAGCLTETGTTAQAPDYLCQMTRAYLALLLQELPAEKQKPYLHYLH